MSYSSQQIFSNASNFTIHGGQFSNVQGDMHVHSAGTERYGLKLLLRSIAPGALHDAAERGDQPGCHENTRVAILKEIMDWLQHPNAREKFFYWLYGPAGSGKTSIAQSIAKALAELGLLNASFFFCRSAAGRNISDHFVATIAYQLSRNLSAMADALYTAIENDPIIFSKSLATQFQVLIINSFKAALQTTPPHETPERIIIIIDGVDECSPTESQVELMGLLRTTVSEFRSIPFPFLCLVSSRPEYEIRSTFLDSKPLGALTTKLALDNDYQTNRDIERYLVSKFNKIRDEHLQLGFRLSPAWPTNHDFNCLVRKASGQFIFAATAMKFIDCPRGDPVEHLKIILGLSVLRTPLSQMPFASLDELYRTILASIAPDIYPKVLDILSLIILGPKLGLRLEVQLIGDLLALDARKTLIDMHALVYVPFNDEFPVHLHHKSFEDFLLDKSRSRNYYLDTAQAYPRLTQHFIHALENSNTLKILQDPKDFDGFLHIFSELCKYLHPDRTLANSFASFNMQLALKHYGGEIQYSHQPWDSFLCCAKTQAGCRDDIFPRLWKEFCIVWLGHIPKQLHSFIPTLISFKELASDLIMIFCYPRLSDGRALAWPLGKDTDITNVLLELLTCEGSQYHLDYLADCNALGKYIIEVIFPMPGQGRYKELYQRCQLDHIVKPSIPWYPELLSRIPMDVEFAEFLHRRALQVFNWHLHIQFNIARYSLKYIKACGIPYLEHTHRPDFRGCIICMYSVLHPGATVLELDDPAQTKFDMLILGMISKSAEVILCAPALACIKGYYWQGIYDWGSDHHMTTLAFKALYRCVTGDSVDDLRVKKLSFLCLAEQSMRNLLLRTDFLIMNRKNNFAMYAEDIFRRCPIDFDFAAFLRDHALLFRRKPEQGLLSTDQERWVAKTCLRYVQRCGIPYLEHTHPPDTVFCTTCSLAEGASVVDAEKLPYVQTSEQSLTIALPRFLSAANRFLAQLGTPTTDKHNLVEDVSEVSLAKRKQSEEDDQDEDSWTTKNKHDLVEDVPEASAECRQSDEDEQDEGNGTAEKSGAELWKIYSAKSFYFCAFVLASFFNIIALYFQSLYAY